MVYRFYVQMQDVTDRMSAVFGNDQASLLVNTPDGAFNSLWRSTGLGTLRHQPSVLARVPRTC